MKNPPNQPGKGISRDITSKEKSDIRTLMRFMEIYCRENHFREKSSFIFNKIYQSGFKNRTRLLGGGDGGVHLSTSSTRRQRQQSYMNEGEVVSFAPVRHRTICLRKRPSFLVSRRFGQENPKQCSHRFTWDKSSY